MPPRKKAKGKARKAAKEAKKEEESRAVGEVAGKQQHHVQKKSFQAMVQQLLRIDAASSKLCRHGVAVHFSVGEEKICMEFINAFITAFRSQNEVGQSFFTALQVTINQYADVYFSKLDTVVSLLLFGGTEMILDAYDNSDVQQCAMLACYFEEWMACKVHETKVVMNWTKIHELLAADDHTLVSYYRKRIPCSCLDEKYKEVKSVKKMGFCYNSNCSQGRKVERSKMLSCTRCGMANYCSVGCQKADWEQHKQFCGDIADAKAELKSRQP